MTTKRKVEVFVAGCPLCDEVVQLVQSIACPSCGVSIHDTYDAGAAARAKSLGVTHVPAVAIDGRLADCCRSGGVDEAALRAAGVGQPVSPVLQKNKNRQIGA